MEGLDGSSPKIFEYIWLDFGGDLRSKTKIYWGDFDKNKGRLPPKWSFDGSSTGQATTAHSDVILTPYFVCSDPFRPQEDAYLVLCRTEHDKFIGKLWDLHYKHVNLKPVFGFEQEFFIIDKFTGSPLIHREVGLTRDYDLSSTGEDSKEPRVLVKGPLTQPVYYCAVGANKVGCRTHLERIRVNCLSIGLKITGLNYEVAPGQCEFQVCDSGPSAADSLLLLRYIIQRTLEPYDLVADFSTKPQGLLDPPNGPKFNASGCHANFSTKEMREHGNWHLFENLIKTLEKSHDTHMIHYGPGNKKRLTGKNETSAYEKFTWGVGDRTVSVRIPLHVKDQGFGYIEDRRPSSAMNPYEVSYFLLKAYVDSLRD